MSTDKMQTGRQSLRPRANIIRVIGNELISDDSVAITELVKNSYDADAALVRLRFLNIDDPDSSELQIEDNGVGMSLETIRDAWLEPATTFKKENKKTARGRRVLGEKGIGRFAAARLARRLEMITKRAEQDTELWVALDWTDFDRGYLDEIACEWHQRRPSLIKKSGTILRLMGLTSKWDHDKIAKLRDSLSHLLSPFEQVEDFTILFDLPESLRNLAGPVSASELLRHPDYVIKGTVAADGTYNLNYEHHQNKENIGPGKFKEPLSPQAGPFQIELRVWDRDRVNIEKLADVFARSAKEIRAELDRSAGVHIYRDKFRVLPYGNPGTDWLGLDHRRVQNPTLRVSQNQVVGVIVVSADTNPVLKDQSNREGIVASQAFEDLKELARNVLSELEPRRYRARRPEEPDKAEKRGGLFTGLSLEPIRAAVQHKYPRDRDTLSVIDTQQEVLDERIAAVQEVFARYQRLATLGQLIDIVLHDGRTPLNKIGSEAQLGQNDVSRLQGVNGAKDRLRSRFAFILAQSDALGHLFRKIEPFGGRKRGRPKTVILEDIIRETFELAHQRIDQLGVDCKLPQSSTSVTLDAVELKLVFWNLLDNSLYWLEHSDLKRKPVVQVEVKRKADELVILFCDSGPGVDAKDRNYIFDPYFSRRPNGVGLGLSIAGEIVAEYDGDLELVSGPQPGACFRATLRRRI